MLEVGGAGGAGLGSGWGGGWVGLGGIGRYIFEVVKNERNRQIMNKNC